MRRLHRRSNQHVILLDLHFILPYTLFVLQLCALTIPATCLPLWLQPRVTQDDQCPVVWKPQPPLDTSTRIVGGQPSGEQLAASMVYLTYTEDGIIYSQTGILVAPTVVLTGAGRGVKQTGEVFVGGRSFRTATKLPISSVVIHPSYDENADNRVLYKLMYIVLASPAPSTARPVKVISNHTYPDSGSFVRHVGYGRSSQSDTNDRNILHQVDVPVYNQPQCAQKFSEYFASPEASDRVYCAGYENRSCSVW